MLIAEFRKERSLKANVEVAVKPCPYQLRRATHLQVGHVFGAEILDCLSAWTGYIPDLGRQFRWSMGL